MHNESIQVQAKPTKKAHTNCSYSAQAVKCAKTLKKIKIMGLPGVKTSPVFYRNPGNQGTSKMSAFMIQFLQFKFREKIFSINIVAYETLAHALISISCCFHANEHNS